MRVLGIDIGFASLGWGILEGDGDKADRFVACGVIETEKTQGIAKAIDSELRALDIAREVETIIDRHGPFERLHIEGVSWTRDAKVTGKIGMAFGIVFSAAARHRWIVNQFPPKTLKYRLTGSASASKTFVLRVVSNLLPASVPTLKSLGYRREHAGDALGAALWGEAYLAKRREAESDPP